MVQQTLSPCCVTGHLHTGTPVGSVEQIVGLDVYVSKPEGGSKAKTILFLTDIFGWELPNARLLADEYAKAGFYVYIPEEGTGDPVSHEHLDTIAPRDPNSKTLVEKTLSGVKTGALLGPWLAKHPEGVAKPLIDKFVEWLRADPVTGKIGAVGFCWGGRYALLVGGMDATVDAIVANHPSLVTVPAEFEALTVPSQINVGDNDPYLSNEQVAQIKEVLAAKPDLPTEINVFEGATHGFAVRADLETPKEKEYKDQSAEATMSWLNKYLA